MSDRVFFVPVALVLLALITAQAWIMELVPVTFMMILFAVFVELRRIEKRHRKAQAVARIKDSSWETEYAKLK